MTFEETLALVFQPGMSEVFLLGASFSLLLFFGICFIGTLFSIIEALIHRFIWPAKEKYVTQFPESDAGIAG